jgi:hypothetical protein
VRKENAMSDQGSKRSQVFDRYLHLHSQWSADPNLKDQVHALPALVLAEAIERALPAALNDFLFQAKTSGWPRTALSGSNTRRGMID